MPSSYLIGRFEPLRPEYVLGRNESRRFRRWPAFACIMAKTRRQMANNHFQFQHRSTHPQATIGLAAGGAGHADIDRTRPWPADLGHGISVVVNAPAAIDPEHRAFGCAASTSEPRVAIQGGLRRPPLSEDRQPEMCAKTVPTWGLAPEIFHGNQWLARDRPYLDFQSIIGATDRRAAADASVCPCFIDVPGRSPLVNSR